MDIFVRLENIYLQSCHFSFYSPKAAVIGHVTLTYISDRERSTTRTIHSLSHDGGHTETHHTPYTGIFLPLFELKIE